MDINQLFAETVRLNASDLHLITGFAPMLRIIGKLEAVASHAILTPQDTETLVNTVLNPEQKDLLANNRELDFSFASKVGRFRVNVYYQKNTIAAAFRLIPNEIKTVDELNLPKICHDLVNLKQGFILVTGPTGQGKSTTLASMINAINLTKPMHIVTIEDPVEYIYPKGMSIISQREMHGDTHSWNVALRSVLREDPDVVLIGEMRDYETIAAALTIAETGHLVFATLHTNSAAQTIDRIVDVFPEHQQSQIRLQLSSALEGVLAQRLIPTVDGKRVPVVEVMTATNAVRTTIRDGKTHLLDNIIQTSAEYGMVPLETALAERVKQGIISTEVATAYALRPDELGRLLKL